MPAKLDVQRTKQLLEAFDFPRLFVEELGWNNPDGRQPIRVQAGEDAYEARPVAELGGVAVLALQIAKMAGATVAIAQALASLGSSRSASANQAANCSNGSELISAMAAPATPPPRRP